MNNKRRQQNEGELDISLSQQITMSMSSKVSITNNRKIIELSNQDEIYYIQPENILYVQADGNNCDIHLTDGDVLETVSFQRAEVARKIDTQLSRDVACNFALVGKPYLINISHIMHINAARQQLTFDVNQAGTCQKKKIKASVEALRSLRKNMENPVCESRCPSRKKERINGGFANYVVQKSLEDKCYETGDDEVMMLGR